MRIEFTGEYAALMGGYVAFRQNLGLAMPEGPRGRLRHMAGLPHATPPVPGAVGTEGAEAIAPGREGEPDAARRGRLVVPRQLCPCCVLSSCFEQMGLRWESWTKTRSIAEPAAW